MTNQLTGANYSNQNNETYTYDPNGNRTNPGYTTALDNRLQTDGVNNFTYDHEGNLITKTAIASGEVTTYTWDYRNRLTNVRVNDRTGRLTRSDSFVYDALDRRIAKIVDPDGADFFPAFTEHFIYQGDNLHLVFDHRGNLIPIGFKFVIDYSAGGRGQGAGGSGERKV